MGLFSAVGYLADSRLNSAFPSIDDLEENRVALENDSFNELRNSIPPSAQMVIFDQNGNRLYASDDDVAKSIDANDLEIINGTEEDQVFYEVLQRFDARYGTVYEINLCGMSGIGSSKIVLSSCVCKLDGTIVEGDLFAGRESLSKRELSLINGEFSANKSIQKLEYVTVDNQPRTLVFISSNVSEATYDELISQNGMIWLSSIPVAVAFTAIAAVVLVRMIRRAAKPLDAAITACKEGGESPDGMHRVPAELVPTYDNFLELMEELKAAQNDKQRIVSDISHDLKTPLTSMVGYIELIKKEELSDLVRDYVDVLSERAEKLKEMINSLFSLAKASSGNIELHPEKFELNRLVEQIFADMHDHVKESELQFVKQLTEENTEIISDNMYFYRICQNLIENALKYSAKHTRVFVKTYQKESSNHLCLEITNTAGYPMDFTKEEIIERFFRGDKQRSSEGNGLGLAIVSTYVKALGGEFDIKIDCDQFKACVEMPLSAITIT